MTDAAIAGLIAELHASSWQGAYRGFYSDRFLDVDAIVERRAFWSARVPQLRALGGQLFLARVGGQPAGFACVETGPARTHGAFIDNLHVLPAFQGRGIGRALVARAGRWARAHGERQLYLYVFEANTAATRFYLATGWRIDGREMHALVTPGEAPVLRMVRDIGAPRPGSPRRRMASTENPS